MKNRYWIAAMSGLCFLAIYIIGYRITYDGTNSAENIKREEETEVRQAAAISEIILKRETELVMETYSNEKKALTGEKLGSLPIPLIGLNKKRTSQYIEENKEKFAGEGEKVTNIRIISFSEEKLVLRKCVDTIEETTAYNIILDTQTPKYYIMLEYGKVVVYRGDMTTLYMETGIKAEELDEEVAAQLRTGICVENISELYRMLESFTS